MMTPAFYDFERLIRQLMVATPTVPATLIARLHDCPDSNRPQLFKQKSRANLAAWAHRAQAVLSTLFGPHARFRTDDANLRGLDLTEASSGQQIELKTGKVTDANIGLSTMAWALEDSSKALQRIMTNSMRHRRRLAISGKSSQVQESKSNTMAALLEHFHDLGLRPGALPPRTLEHFARCVAHGITKLAAAKPLLNKPESEWEIPTILHASWEKGWIPRSTPFAPEGFLVKNVHIAPDPKGSTTPRVRLRLQQPKSRRTALFYPNYKNGFTTHAGIRLSADNWVQTACFHVWLDK